ncbi:MAG: hypothetical protein BroJett012_07870 [Betaproteobacteria bacterium]|jgi:hypothetical protein|nr:MAG: hypothetical protein BroJett012_07870 [Betaproteobacteria bacterium]
MAPWVRYYHMPRGKVVERNAGIAVVFGEWPEGALKSRGWRPEREVCRRLATQEEENWLKKCMRHQAILYPDVDGLLEDEGRLIGGEVFARIEKVLRGLNVQS